jgi:RHS repeat-associated protein
LRIRAVLSSIRRRTAARWWYKVGFTVLSICLIGAAKFDSLSEASAAIRHYAMRARMASVTTAPDTVIFFGPKQFVTVANNNQINFAESFGVPSLTSCVFNETTGECEWATNWNEYRMRLQRVGGSLTTATVVVNGTQVATVADFGSTTFLERSIRVNQIDYSTNSFTISLKGAAGAGLIATIVGTPSASYNIFGPTFYTKAATTPTHFVTNVISPLEGSAPYSITAVASVAGTKATITLGGVQVIKDTDFGTNVTVVTKSVNLAYGNVPMVIDVRGNTGTTIMVSVSATDKLPPTLTIGAPSQNFVTNASTVTVSGTSQDREETQVKVNGIVATMSGTPRIQFSATVPLNQGANTLAIRATDHAGNHTDSTRTVTRDTVAPAMTVTSPADQSYTSQDAVTVAGTVSDASTVTVKVNGILLPVGQGGAFTGNYTVVDGANFLTITATDAGGNVISQIRKVTQVKQPPVLTVTGPTRSQLWDGNFGFYTNITPTQVSGTVTGPAPMTITVNGVSTPISNGAFSTSAALTEGWNNLIVAVTGPSGLVRQELVNGRLNTAPPSFYIDTPRDADGQSHFPWATSPTTVFTIFPDAFFPPPFPYVSATLNGVALTVDSTGRFRGSIPLSEGPNDLTAIVTDNAGRVGVAHENVILDTHPPVVELTSPAEGAHFSTEPVLVSGTADSGPEDGKMWLSVNGVFVNNGGPFSTQIHLDSGTNVISIEVLEASGNKTTLTRTVTFGAPLDNLPPDPATIAPMLDATIATTTFAATSFLYTGPNPIQTGVVAGTIQPLQAAVIRGTVRTRTGDALPAVKVTVLDHPEFGQTLSRADGAFDLVVNGGEPITLNYEKTGFLPAQRQAPAQWQDRVIVESVTLVSLDAVVTTVNVSQPDSSQTAQVARGGIVTDESGTRQATVIFKSGTHASLRMPDGTLQPLTSIAVRATEYTVGPTGQSAMPAPLPGTSGYTYAVDLTADEAISAGATSVVFDQPVAFYVDNFLHFPIGTPVPVGFYDRDKAQWVTSPNGRIVKVLQVTNGRASLDVDGSGSEATSEALVALGVNEAELTKLGALYAPGNSLWRVQLSHFTPYDLNWAYRVDTSMRPPKRPDPKRRKVKDKDCPKLPGSVIGCERQTLGQSMGIAGTSLRLNYQSDGSRGYREAYSTDISLIGDTVPTNLRRIELEVRIAGRLVKNTYSADPNQTIRLLWDGNDAYDRPVHGTQTAVIRIGYTYPASNYDYPRFPTGNGDFGAYGDSLLTGDPVRFEVTLWQEMTSLLGVRDTRAEGLGGWSLGVHHYYDPVGKVLLLGDGSRRSAADLPNATTTIAGTDCTANCANIAKPGDRAVDAFIGVQGFGLARDGTMYIGDASANKIWHVNAAGILELVGGNGSASFGGDGGPATSAGMAPRLLKVGPDSSIYFIDFSSGRRVRRIDKNGIITTVAGTGTCGNFLAPGTLANQANLCFTAFALGKDGTLFLVDRTEVYKVGADGILTRIVGDGSYVGCASPTPSYTCAEGKQAYAHGAFHGLVGIAIGDDGSLYLANREFRVLSALIIYRIGPDGIIRRYAGNGNDFGSLGNGGLATNAAIVSRATELNLAADGTLYFTEDFGYIAYVDQTGILRLAAGCISSPGPATCDRNSGGRATLTTLTSPRGLDFGPDGRLYILDRIARRVDAPLPALGINVSTVASEDGSELYVFDATGRHLRTLDALLGTAIYDFAYDAAGLLSTITDVDGNVIQVVHDGAGAPTAIVAPFGQRTELTVNSSNSLATVTPPGEPATVLSYSADGLLQTLTDAKGNLHRFTYDDNGLLVRDEDPAGGFKSLLRAVTDSSSAVTVTTALGVSITHGTASLSTGATRRTSIDAAGLASTEVTDVNGTVTVTYADSMTTTITSSSDPRFGMQAPVLSKMTTKTPGGLVATVTNGRRTVLSDPTNPLSLETQLDSSVVAGQVFRSTYVAATRTLTLVSPMGRSSTRRFDALGRVIEETSPEISPILYQYDTRGRLSQMSHGSRQMSYTYDARDRLATVTDPLSRTSQYFYDAADRLTHYRLTDGREIQYSYDSIGNLASLTPPGRQPHQFQYNSLNLLTSYNPPNVGAGTWATTYGYDLDGKLAQVTRPDGQIIGFGYDVAGRRTSTSFPNGAMHYTYHPGTGNLSGISGPYGEAISFSYDGLLLTAVTWSGEVQGSVSATYNNLFQVTGLSVNGRSAIGLSYDNEGSLQQAGALVIQRNANNGAITGTDLAGVTTSQSYTPQGELAHRSANIGGTAIFDVSYTRDSASRIANLTETVNGTTTVKAYNYDLSGRLLEVRENGILTGAYEYDANGNRARFTGPNGTVSGVYDAQDRLVNYGGVTYTYARNGELSAKAVGSTTTQYEYDVMGNLRSVGLSDGTLIQYVVDGMNRRVGKKVNGSLVQAFLYEDQLRPVAELDGGGSVVSEFVYGSRPNVPDYMIKDGLTYRILTDHLGSVRLVVRTADGVVVQQLAFDEFGRQMVNTNPGFQPFGYAGGLTDQQTGLVRFGARDYDAEVGRFTSKDPSGLLSGENLYVYASSDVVNRIDPTGLCDCDKERLKRLNPDNANFTRKRGATNPNKVEPYFTPDFESKLESAIREMNKQGVNPQINAGYRTNADQVWEREHPTNPNRPGQRAATGTSLHQLGLAVDMQPGPGTTTRSAEFKNVVTPAMQNAGFELGAAYGDVPHFYLPDSGSNRKAAAKQLEAYFKKCIDPNAI